MYGSLTSVAFVGIASNLVHNGRGGSPILVGKNFVNSGFNVIFGLGLVEAERIREDRASVRH